MAEQAPQKHTHTPGPWQSHHDFDLDGELQIIGNVDGPDDGSYDYTCICCVDDGDEASANARLIAAAPELLEALRLFRGRLLPYTSGTDEAIRKADAAIARAEGRS